MNEFKEIIDNLKDLKAYIDEQVGLASNLTRDEQYQSKEINELAEALAAAQGEYPLIPFNRTNASWSDEYSDLDIILRYIRPMLSKNRLAITQWTKLTQDGQTILHTELMHASGQWKGSRIKIVPSRNDIKSFDSALADYRRHQAKNLLGVALEGDPKDDDGEIDMAIAYEEAASGASNKLVRTKESFECITKEQLDELEYELNGYPDLAEELLLNYHLRALGDMPKTKFKFAVEQIRKFKNYRKKGK